MTVSAFAGTFNIGTGTGTIDVQPAGCTISGVSIVFLFWNGRTSSTDANGRATLQRGMGAAVSSTDRWAIVAQSVDAGTAQAGSSYHTNAACIVSVTGRTTVDGLADFNSWLSDGFRLDRDDAMPVDYRIGYLLITGLDNATTGNINAPAATGNASVTGKAFQPDCVLFATNMVTTAPPAVRNDASGFGIGFAVSSSQRATYFGGTDEGSATMDTESYCLDIECACNPSASMNTAMNNRWDFVSMNSDGFTYNVLEFHTTGSYFHYAMMKGGSWTVTNVLTRTDSNDIATASLGFEPEGVLMVSACKAESTQDTPTTDDIFSLGAASSDSARWCLAARDEHGTGNAEVATAIEHDEVYCFLENTAGVITIDALMDVKTGGFGSNTITFVMDDTETLTQKFVPMLIVGNAAAAPTSLVFDDRQRRSQPLIVR